METLSIKTHGEGFTDFTGKVREAVADLTSSSETKSGLLTLFVPHTSCALTINESYDPSAKEDMENFLKNLAPRNLKFIKHTMEGPDDSPSHMKSILLQTSLTFLVEKGELMLGTWQGIYLCEFRDSPKTRKVWVKFMEGE